MLLNITPIRYSDGVVEIEVLPYESAEQLKALRRQYGNSHVFRRSGESIQCVPRSVDAPFLGGTRTEVAFRDNLKLVASLAQEAILSWFYGKGLLSESFDPVSVVGKGNLLDEFPEVAEVLNEWYYCCRRWISYPVCQSASILNGRPSHMLGDS
ncbi:hypothetical protein [Burkholderia pseudomallei]|uniref:hypothetical protein n=1 Tax=Burkholderia pseudomallei TaxID=28450 RepID=UPI000F4D9687|nr:hypothetical protein [Burkholderia pseudomallei]